MNSVTPKDGIELHDVPEDGLRADFHHGFRAACSTPRRCACPCRPRESRTSWRGAVIRSRYRAICASENFAMFSPAEWAKYQSAVHDSDSRMSSLGRQPRACAAKAEDRVSACASAGCGAGSRTQPGLPANLAPNASTTSRTVQKDAGSGPKLTARGVLLRRRAPAPAPGSDSRTGLEHMLPGPHGIGIAQVHGLPGLERPDAVGNEPVFATSRRRR